MGDITIVGLGPGAFSLITMETWDKLRQAECLLLRTAKHPCVEEIKQRGVTFASFDHVYEELSSFDEVYSTIATEVVHRAAQGERVVYAVPGSPLVAEKTVALIRDKAAKNDIAISILPGMSFLEVLYTRLGVDPIDGVTIVDAADIARLPLDLGTALVVTQVYNQQVASEAKLAMMEQLPDDYQVTVTRNLGLPDEEIHCVALFELDRLPQIDHLTSVYVPPRPLAARFALEPLVDVMARLRSPNGCVWDIEQTHSSLRRYIVEEVYEVIEAIDLEDSVQLCEELGDLLLQIVFHARIAEEFGEFTMQDVVNEVTEKMVRRHPHVFGDVSVRDAAEVVVNWDAIKKGEKGHERKSVLDGVPSGLPSLMRAYKLQGKAAKVGFDWDNIGPVWEKIEEELVELKEAAALGDVRATEGELGDVLFAVVNLARFLHIEPETALNVTNNKFLRRFAYIEDYVNRQGAKWENLSLQQLDKLWDEAKASEIGKNK